MQTKQKTFADDEGCNPFITLGQLIHRGVSIQALTLAIRQDGIYTFDRVDLLCKASPDDLKIVSDCLVAQYDYEKDFVAYIESTGMPVSPLELCEEPPRSSEEEEDRYNPYDQFGWPENEVPVFKVHPNNEPKTKPRGHLDHDHEWQRRANAIAVSQKHRPTKAKVANLLAKELGKTEETVRRRIRVDW